LHPDNGAFREFAGLALQQEALGAANGTTDGRPLNGMHLRAHRRRALFGAIPVTLGGDRLDLMHLRAVIL
jgi:hypothetical protein